MSPIICNLSKIIITFFLIPTYIIGQNLDQKIITNYKETTDDIITEFTYTESRNDTGYIVEFKNTNRVEKCITDTNYSCVQWEYENPVKKSNFTAVRVGNKIFVNGTFEGENLNRIVEVENHKWFQFWEFGIKKMIESNLDEMKFISFDPNELNDGATFIIEKEDEEIIVLNNQEIKSNYLTVSIKGLPSFLFEADFWFAKTDNLFLKSEMPQGPFAPTTTIEILTD